MRAESANAVFSDVRRQMFHNRTKNKGEEHSVDIIEVLVDFTPCGIRIADLWALCVTGGTLWWGIGIIGPKAAAIKVMNEFKNANL